jgi:FG-GAP-like repeat
MRRRELPVSCLYLIAISVLTLQCSGTPSQTNQGHYQYNKFTLTTGKAPGSTEIADLNHDSQPDIIVVNAQSGTATIYLNNGKGNFTEPPGSPVACGSFPNDIAIADFNNDKNIDFAIANTEENHFTLLTGNGKGQFEMSKYSPFKVRSRPHIHGIAAADFDHDSNIDVLSESWGVDSVFTVSGIGNGNFRHPRYFKVGRRPYQRLRTADVNHDNNADIITTNLESRNSTVLLGDGKGSFTEAPNSPFACGAAPFAVAINDINHDGHPDLLIGDSPSITAESKGTDGLFILMGDGTGNFKPLNGSPFTTESPSRVASGDLDGNGFNDIAVVNYTHQTMTIFLMNKEGVQTQEQIRVGGHPDGIAVADLNGDGKADVVVSNGDDDSMAVFLSQ